MLSPTHIEAILEMPEKNDRAVDLEFGDEPAKVIILEYFPDAEMMSIDNVTHPIADKALRGLADVHAAYVLHEDIHRHNILVLPGECVVWVDFNQSRNGSSKKLTRSDLFPELSEGWDYLYMSMVRRSLLHPTSTCLLTLCRPDSRQAYQFHSMGWLIHALVCSFLRTLGILDSLLSGYIVV